MKRILLLGLLSLGVVITSCEKEEDSSTTTTTTTSTTKTLVTIKVENYSEVGQAYKQVDMFDKEISDTQLSTVLKSVTTNSSGLAVFDLENIATDTEKTFYFGVFEQNGNSYELKGSRKVEGIKKNTEITANLVITN